MKAIKQLFIKITKKLNEKGVVPTIYGSLGLSLKLNKLIDINDIDFLVKDSREFNVCKKLLVDLNFKIDPDHSRELIGKIANISFLDISEVEKLIGEKLRLEKNLYHGVDFKNIGISQYLKIYKEGLKNKYRKEKKTIDDEKKIKLIIEGKVR
ncbi:MAG: hypothetical protein Q7J14_01850 [Candidatus Magasanikbacteria bacterium]|nr:hypothetical protein [Candidatus Magasanikbacteria bacterium]